MFKISNHLAQRKRLMSLKQSLLEVVSEKTGYPTEMLDLGMDMEADLGIDSIKRVEILGAMQEKYPEPSASRRGNPGRITYLAADHG